MGKQHHKKQAPHDNKRREAKEHQATDVEQGLSVIFRVDNGEVPDLSKLDRRRSNLLVWIFVGVCTFLIILISAIWLGFAIFKPFNGFKGQGLKITIDGPERISIGQETTYFVNYQNISSEPLATSDIRLSFPSDFTMTTMNPKPTTSGMDWLLGAIPFGGRGTIIVKGIFTGAIGTKTAIQAVGTYRPASFNSDFEALTTKNINYASSVLNGSFDKPIKVLPGDTVRIAYTVQNNGAKSLNQLEARITLPHGFIREASSTDKLLDGRVVHFLMGTLAPGATSTVAVTGTFASGASGNLPLHAEVGHESSNDTFLAALKTDDTISVLAGELLVKLLVNGSAADRSVSGGDILQFSLAYQNTSAEDIKGITLRAIFEPVPDATNTSATIEKSSSASFVDWSKFKDSSSGVVKGGVVTWTNAQIDELKRMPPQADGTIEFSIPVSSYASGTPDIPYQVMVEATMKSVGETEIDRTIKTTPIIFRLKTDADLATEARFFSKNGVQLGSGPLPPVSGQTTTYQIRWEVDKTLHELSDLRVHATLPKDVTWPNMTAVSAGDIAYDSSSRTVTWTLNRLPADMNKADATFDVQLTPAAADIGRFVQLTGDTRFDATDVDLNEPLIRIKPGLNTDLQNDVGAKNKGVVRLP